MQAAAAGDDLPVAADPPLIVTVKKFGSSETVDLPAHTAVTHVTGRYFENMDIRRLKQELKKRGVKLSTGLRGVPRQRELSKRLEKCIIAERSAMKRAQGTGIAQMLKSNLHLIGEENARRHRDLMDKAILRSDFDHMVALISRGAADPDFETINGFTPLIRACFCRNIDAVRTIISLGADPNYETRKYETAMIWAASVDGGSQLLLAMVESAEERNIKIDFDNETKLGVTALMAACEVQNLEAIDVLIENLKVNPDRKNGKGLTALMCACRFGKREAAFKLLNSGAKLNLKDRKGRDAVAWTKEAGHYELAKTLTEESWRWKRETSKRGSLSSIAGGVGKKLWKILRLRSKVLRLEGDWEVLWDPSSAKEYYHNKVTGDTTWDIPKSVFERQRNRWHEAKDPISGTT